MLRFGSYELDEARRLLHRAGTRVSLEPRVFDLLIYLIRNRDRAVPHDELLTHVWAGVVVERSVLPVTVRKLRRALDETGEDPFVETVHGFGFRFHGQVLASTSSSDATRAPAHTSRSNSAASASLPTLTVLTPYGIAEASRELGALTREALVIELHRYRVLPVLPAEFVTDRTGRLLPSARGTRVRYALSAHASRSGNDCEALVRLTDLLAERVVWSRRSSVPETEPVAAARSLAAQIAASLWTSFMLGRVELPLFGSAPDAWTHSCAGWRAYWTESWEGMRGSLAMFETALRGDDASAWARVGRSLAAFTRYYFDPQQTQLLDAANRDVCAVLDTDPDSVLAQTYRAIYLRAEGKLELAESLLERAQAQSPELGWIACNLADMESTGDPARALRTYQRALRLDGGELRGRILTGVATAERLLGDFEGALADGERAIAAKPAVPYGYLQAAAACGALGSTSRGQDLLRRFRKHVPPLAPGVVRAHVRVKEGRRPSYGEETLPFLRSAGWGELC